MRGRYLQFGAMIVVLLGALAAYVVTGLRLFSTYEVAYAGYVGTCDSLISWRPPSVVYTAFYANGPALGSLSYRSPFPTTLAITLAIPGLTAPQTIEVHATPTPQTYVFKPPLLGAQALDALVGPKQRLGELDLQVTHNGTAACSTSAPLLLMSRQWMHWADPVAGDDSPYLAGWVTPQDPVITTLIGRATSLLVADPENYPALSRLAGYDSGRATPEAVREEVDLLFDTLQFTYHLHYAQDNIPILQNTDQIIQLPRDILSSSTPTGMCVETTAIMASAVERLGMRPYIVLVPGHAFLGVALGTGASAPLAYWETSDLNGGVTGNQANVHGNAEYSVNAAHRTILHVVDILAERAQGILPIE